jgi:hypothetical protein
MAQASATYFRDHAGLVDPPQCGKDSGVEEHDGQRYAVLHNCNGVLAAWRIDHETGKMFRITKPGAWARY